MKKHPILIVAMLSLLAACAGVNSGNTISLLSAAGFTPKTPKTEKQFQVYDDIDSYKLLTGKVNGQRLYGYKDPKQGVVYVGNEKQYQSYKRMALEQQIAEENYLAAEMDQTTINQYRTLVPYGYWR